MFASPLRVLYDGQPVLYTYLVAQSAECFAGAEKVPELFCVVKRRRIKNYMIMTMFSIYMSGDDETVWRVRARFDSPTPARLLRA